MEEAWPLSVQSCGGLVLWSVWFVCGLFLMALGKGHACGLSQSALSQLDPFLLQ